MLTRDTVLATSLMLGAALVWTLAACPEPQPSPLVPAAECDPAGARDRAADTCANWSEAIDSRPDYCTKSGAVVDGYTWCEEGPQ